MSSKIISFLITIISLVGKMMRFLIYAVSSRQIRKVRLDIYSSSWRTLFERARAWMSDGKIKSNKVCKRNPRMVLGTEAVCDILQLLVVRVVECASASYRISINRVTVLVTELHPLCIHKIKVTTYKICVFLLTNFVWTKKLINIRKSVKKQKKKVLCFYIYQLTIEIKVSRTMWLSDTV